MPTSSGTANLGLFLKGVDPDSTSGNIPLYMRGATSGVGYIYGSTDLFINGAAFSSSMNLYLNGSVGDTSTYSDSLNLFLQSDFNSYDNSIDLYIEGQQGTEQLYQYYLIGNELYTLTPDEYYTLLAGGSGITPIVIQSYYDYMNLFLKGDDNSNYGNIDLFLKVDSQPVGYSDDIDLYMYGVSGVIASGINLYTKGIGLSNNHVDLFIRGYNANQ